MLGVIIILFADFININCSSAENLASTRLGISRKKSKNESSKVSVHKTILSYFMVFSKFSKKDLFGHNSVGYLFHPLLIVKTKSFSSSLRGVPHLTQTNHTLLFCSFLYIHIFENIRRE